MGQELTNRDTDHQTACAFRERERTEAQTETCCIAINSVPPASIAMEPCLSVRVVHITWPWPGPTNLIGQIGPAISKSIAGTDCYCRRDQQG